MAVARARWLLFLMLFLAAGSSAAAGKPPVPETISDALVGQAVAYKFDIEVGRKVLPVRLLEDVSRWDFVDLPIFRSQADADDTTLAEIRQRGRGSIVDPTLPPLQLA